MSKKFVIVVDAQVDFMTETGALYVPESEPIIGKINDYLSNLNSGEYAGVLYTQDTHDSLAYPESLEAEAFPPHCYENTEGWEIAVTENINVPAHYLTKGVFDMWAEDNLMVAYENSGGNPKKTERDVFFSNLQLSGITEVEVVGVAADFCVKWAVDGLAERGFKVTVKGDLTAGIERDISTVFVQDWIEKDIRIA